MKFHFLGATVDGKAILAYRTENEQNRVYSYVPVDLQLKIDKKFDFQRENILDTETFAKVSRFATMWLNPKTQKLAELLYL